MNNGNMSSGKGLTLVKTTLLPGQERVTVVASLPTSPSCDVTANIPIHGCFTLDMDRHDIGSVTATTHQEKGLFNSIRSKMVYTS